MVLRSRGPASTVGLLVEEIVGVVPAAGRSRRLGRLPCSKELFPVGVTQGADGSMPAPKVVSRYLLDGFRLAGIRKTYIVIREGKWDIPQYFLDGREVQLELAYLVIPGSTGPPDTVDRAYPFLAGKTVAFGFPDIILEPTDVFVQLARRWRQGGSDVVLGLFRAHDTRAMDMVDVDRTGRVRSLTLKPRRSNLQFAWVCAIWGPRFTEFLHGYLSDARGARRGARPAGNRRIDAQGDVPVGAVIQAAVREGLSVDGVMFRKGRYIDIGTPTDLVKAVRTYHSVGH